MHLVCQGNTKALLKKFILGKKKLGMGKKNLHVVNEILIMIRNFQPDEFNRKSRTLEELKFWKATELRTFLLYLGASVLKGKLPEDVYYNFIKLHVAAIILIDPSLSQQKKFINYAEKLIKDFVEKCHVLYGKKFITHNLHNLLHLPDDVRKYGALDQFSAFKFENNLRLINSNIRKNTQYLQQLVKRYAERSIANINDYNNVKEKKFSTCTDRIPEQFLTEDSFVSYFNKYESTDFTIDCKDQKNNCLSLENNVMLRCKYFAKNGNNEVFVIGTQLQPIGELYKKPIRASKLNIHVVKETIMHESFKFNFKKKLFVFPHEDNFVAFPLLHT